ncbi:baseplate J/gp47 family protein [Klebsiella michiganensis]|uniref:baseplate J/gp47 family protein n=1 Tax=Klebsiella TaxID=570 RepID=UPI000A3694DD|nr:baseplate J/gp47 family protein [Klebsiella michiganensis]MCW9337069.1 baseplate J/gp47 family protein [Klebsiella michiganensis]OUG40284.1 baseplate J protein [Klebsiella michiganensis]
MPFKRKTLSELRTENQQFMQAELEKVGALLRFGNLKVLADMDAGMAHLHYAYLDYIARQCTPFTSTDEWLAGWMALKQAYRKAATAARSPEAQIKGTSGRTLDAGAVINRADGYQYTTDAGVTIGSSGTATVAVTAVLPDIADDVTGGGSLGNADAGTILTLDANVSGIESTVMLIQPATGGADIEDEEDFRQRGLLLFQHPPQGGSDTDYRTWALAVSGVTRAWVRRRGMGPGTVVIYIMCDGNDKTNHGFPVGTDGISQLEEWGAVKASGDQGRVADYMYPLTPVTSLNYICSPTERVIDFEISGISDASSTTTAAIAEAIDSVLFESADPLGTGKIYLSDLNRAIGDVSGTAGFILVSPSANIEPGIGEMAVRGEVNYT